MTELLAIAIGGALGALARHGVTQGGTMLFGADFPYGTLIVNVAGSLLIGVAYVAIVERGALNPALRPALMVGFLGAFTTFSTYSLQAIALLQEGRGLAAASYVMGSVVLCLVATGIGIALTRTLP